MLVFLIPRDDRDPLLFFVRHGRAMSLTSLIMHFYCIIISKGRRFSNRLRKVPLLVLDGKSSSESLG
jgi:hypothetical protein